MNFPLLCIIVFSLLTFSLKANTDVRLWTLANGDSINAELVSFDTETKEVKLLIDNSKDMVLSYADFSSLDRAWLIEWSELGEELVSLEEKLGGDVEHVVVDGEFQTDLYVYYPSMYKGEKKSKTPLLILFHAGGKGLRHLYRHMEAAEEAQLMIISCGQFRNSKDNPEVEANFLKQFKEVWGEIQKGFKYDPEKVFMGGNSGGAWRAYHYTAWVEYAWAGVYANGGWLGRSKYHSLDYADNMRVCMVNGNNDRSANQFVKPVTDILLKHDAKVSVISFEGGHQIPPVKSQVKAFQWLTETVEPLEE